jgi:ABC-type spermidine/putrescine transport system permease subunit II
MILNDFVLSLFTTQINTKNYGKCMYTFLQNISKNIYIHSFLIVFAPFLIIIIIKQTCKPLISVKFYISLL